MSTLPEVREKIAQMLRRVWRFSRGDDPDPFLLCDPLPPGFVAEADRILAAVGELFTDADAGYCVGSVGLCRKERMYEMAAAMDDLAHRIASLRALASTQPQPVDQP